MKKIGHTAERILEIIPGAISWSLLIGPALLAFSYPQISIYVIIIYTFLWLMKSLEMGYNLIGSYRKIKKLEKKDFQQLAKEVDSDLKPEDIRHIIILATYKEPYEVLKRSVEAILASNYAVKEQVIFTLAYEERDRERGSLNFAKLKEEYGEKFNDFYGYMHPATLEGEVQGKGSNITYAGRQLLKEVERKQLDPAKILVTTLDADNCVGKQYLSYLSYEYLRSTNRKHVSFQPIPFFNNNFWKVSMINRVTAISSSFWQMIESNRPSRLRNFSAHAQSLATLIDTDFWSVTTIVEDGHQYWRTYFTYNGNHNVTPLFVPIYQDAVQANTVWDMLQNQYKQLRRWAWGVSDIPYVLKNAWLKRKELPFFKTTMNTIRLFEGHIMWATLAITITINNRLIVWANPDFSRSVLSYNTSFILERLFIIALMGLAVLIYMSLLFAPKRKNSLVDGFLVLIQWALLPIVTIVFGSIPALDAQTRLMFGKKLEFWVTPKQVRSIKEKDTTKTPAEEMTKTHPTSHV